MQVVSMASSPKRLRRRELPRPPVLWHSGTGENLIWLPVVICVVFMVTVVVWSSWAVGAETDSARAAARSNISDTLLGR